jgi:hypothetical protein
MEKVLVYNDDIQSRANTALRVIMRRI